MIVSEKKVLMVVAALFVALACASAATYKVTGEATYAYAEEECLDEMLSGSGMCMMELPDDLLAEEKDGVEEREPIKASEEGYVLEEILAQQPMEQPMMQQEEMLKMQEEMAQHRQDEMLKMQQEEALTSEQSIVKAQKDNAAFSTEQDILKQSFLDDEVLEEQFEELQ